MTSTFIRVQHDIIHTLYDCTFIRVQHDMIHTLYD